MSKESVPSTLTVTVPVLAAGCTSGIGRPRTHEEPSRPVGGEKDTKPWAYKQRKLRY